MNSLIINLDTHCLIIILILGLVHSNCDVRSAAFSIICEVKKKGKPPTKQEMNIVVDFLTANSIEDNSRLVENNEAGLNLFNLLNNINT